MSDPASKQFLVRVPRHELKHAEEIFSSFHVSPSFVLRALLAASSKAQVTNSIAKLVSKGHK